MLPDLRTWATIASLALLLAGSACGAPETGTKVGDRIYKIPPSHIRSQSDHPHRFIRIKHPETPFELVYDSRSEHERDERGHPRIFGVNDEKAPDIDYYRTSKRVVVCRRAANPKGGCGTKVNYGGANWSIIYPDSRIGETERLASQAASLLKQYDIRGK